MKALHPAKIATEEDLFGVPGPECVEDQEELYVTARRRVCPVELPSEAAGTDPEQLTLIFHESNP